ncbi:hypothetical protein SKAU_G00228210 [Synaphobranchus kaupii]|uniref:Uncharacterized protein n=1 Tax=Synaphobranchus kaupii TaxID=118154 RepID=A0A9Q1F5B5_SYNKA|nr:hypothetical protein SKAU_G00228210 [Synaphobranchus kaupii]
MYNMSDAVWFDSQRCCTLEQESAPGTRCKLAERKRQEAELRPAVKRIPEPQNEVVLPHETSNGQAERANQDLGAALREPTATAGQMHNPTPTPFSSVPLTAGVMKRAETEGLRLATFYKQETERITADNYTVSVSHYLGFPSPGYGNWNVV